MEEEETGSGRSVGGHRLWTLGRRTQTLDARSEDTNSGRSVGGHGLWTLGRRTRTLDDRLEDTNSGRTVSGAGYGLDFPQALVLINTLYGLAEL